MLLHFTSTQRCQDIAAVQHSVPSPVGLHIVVLSLSYLVVNFAPKYQRILYTSSNLLIIFATRACRPRYRMMSAMDPHKSHTIPSLSVASVWLCITLLISKAHCSNDTSPFWVESPLNVLNFGILPSTCEVTLGHKILHWGSEIGIGNCMFAPSTDMISSFPTYCKCSPTIICSGVATLHPVCRLWPNHISMYGDVWHNFSIFSPSAKTNKVFLLSSLWITIGSMVVHSHTNPTTMSGLVNAGDNGCPLSNS